MKTSHKPVYLLAGGRGQRRENPDPLMQAVLRESGIELPIIAYVGTANDDDRGFFDRMASAMKEAGAGVVNHAVIAPEGADIRRARAILKAADIVFISGGDVEKGMTILRKKDMVGALSELYQQGKPFFGISAGAIMLARKWIRWRNPDDEASAELFPCLGFAPIICDTHDEQGGWQELKAALRLEGEGAKGYGLVSGTGVRVFADGRLQVLGGAVHQYIRRGEKVERIDNIFSQTN